MRYLKLGDVKRDWWIIVESIIGKVLIGVAMFDQVLIVERKVTYWIEFLTAKVECRRILRYLSFIH